MKKIFEMIGFTFLLLFTLTYSDQISLFIKENDQIVKEIRNVSDEYYEEPIDAFISDNTIIPGISGFKIDVWESYNNMSKIGVFNENLIELDNIKPNISIIDNYDKYIISGNESINQIYLVFSKEDETLIKQTMNILNSKHARGNFLMNNNFISLNSELIDTLVSHGHNILIKDNFKNSQELLYKQKNNFCYLNNFNDDILKECSHNKIYTIVSNINVKNNYLINLKNNLNNGLIIEFELSNQLTKELPSMIEYMDYRDIISGVFTDIIND